MSNGPDDDWEEDDDENQSSSSAAKKDDDGPQSLNEELDCSDLGRVMFFKDNKIFSAVGPSLPIVQLDRDGAFVSHAPDQPYRNEVDVELTVEADEHGRLLDPLGEVRKLSGMKYQGHQLYYIVERHPENQQHLAAWFDDNWNPHRLYLNDTILSAQMIIRVRDRMIDGEISAFPEIRSE